MSDIPEGYYMGHMGQVLLDFRREPLVQMPGVGPSKSKRSGSKRIRRRKKLLERDGSLCHYCDVEMCNPEPFRQLEHAMTIEHVVPLAVGGSYEMENLVLACFKCNNGFNDIEDKCSCNFCNEAKLIHERNQQCYPSHWKSCLRR